MVFKDGIEKYDSALKLSFLMMYALLYERYQQFYSCVDMVRIIKGNQQNQKQQKLQQQGQNISIKISTSSYIVSFKDKVMCLILVVSFTDWLMYVKLRRVENNVFKIIFKKRVQDLCSENLAFFCFSTVYFVKVSIEENKVDKVALISQFLSYFNCFVVFFQIYLRRIEKFGKYRVREQFSWIFQQSFEVQEYICNPSQLQILKFYVGKKAREYQNHICNNLNEIQQKKQVQKVGIWKKVYIGVFIFVNTFGFLYLLSIQIISEGSIQAPLYVVFGLVFHLPQIVLHAYIVLKNINKEQDFMEKVILIAKILYKVPINALTGAYQFILPFPIYEIPFIKETRQIWKLNFYPTVYVLMVNLAQEVYLSYIAYRGFVKGEGLYSLLVDGPDKKDIVMNRSKILFNIYLCVMGLIVVDVSQKVGMIVGHIYKELQKQFISKKQEKYSQSKYQDDKDNQNNDKYRDVKDKKIIYYSNDNDSSNNFLQQQLQYSCKSMVKFQVFSLDSRSSTCRKQNNDNKNTDIEYDSYENSQKSGEIPQDRNTQSINNYDFNSYYKTMSKL